SKSEIGLKGLSEVELMLQYLSDSKADISRLDFDVTLARGLSYYTGAIYEVKVNNVQIGSASGGGRYDNLTGVFGLDGVSGVGISFGVDRLYDVMEELDLFPSSSSIGTQVLITHFDEACQRHGLTILQELRQAGIRAEIYPDETKLKKQMNYADKKNIAYVIVVGSEEMQSREYSLKDMIKGDQEALSIKEIVSKLKSTEQ